ncbi:hypothetical protein GOODEAATRI_033373 [Goodea atripinnis]|uniref:Uncharacterized protein n=1 Tax=Goodea atripinnis TaxID=208336 RepID=A0ABV0MMR2_9TELE
MLSTSITDFCPYHSPLSWVLCTKHVQNFNGIISFLFLASNLCKSSWYSDDSILLLALPAGSEQTTLITPEPVNLIFLPPLGNFREVLGYFHFCFIFCSFSKQSARIIFFIHKQPPIL